MSALVRARSQMATSSMRPFTGKDLSAVPPADKKPFGGVRNGIRIASGDDRSAVEEDLEGVAAAAGHDVMPGSGRDRLDRRRKGDAGRGEEVQPLVPELREGPARAGAPGELLDESLFPAGRIEVHPDLGGEVPGPEVVDRVVHGAGGELASVAGQREGLAEEPAREPDAAHESQGPVSSRGVGAVSVELPVADQILAQGYSGRGKSGERDRRQSTR